MMTYVVLNFSICSVALSNKGAVIINWYRGGGRNEGGGKNSSARTLRCAKFEHADAEGGASFQCAGISEFVPPPVLIYNDRYIRHIVMGLRSIVFFFFQSLSDYFY